MRSESVCVGVVMVDWGVIYRHIKRSDSTEFSKSVLLTVHSQSTRSLAGSRPLSGS